MKGPRGVQPEAALTAVRNHFHLLHHADTTLTATEIGVNMLAKRTKVRITNFFGRYL